MRKVFTSPRLENVEAVAALLQDEGVDVITARTVLQDRLDGLDGGADDYVLKPYDVPELLVRLSAVCPLLPGDLIFSGTPSGIGNRRTPPRFIGPDDVLVSEIEGIGTLTTRFTAR